MNAKQVPLLVFRTISLRYGKRAIISAYANGVEYEQFQLLNKSHVHVGFAGAIGLRRDSSEPDYLDERLVFALWVEKPKSSKSKKDPEAYSPILLVKGGPRITRRSNKNGRTFSEDVVIEFGRMGHLAHRGYLPFIGYVLHMAQSLTADADLKTYLESDLSGKL